MAPLFRIDRSALNTTTNSKLLYIVAATCFVIALLLLSKTSLFRTTFTLQGKLQVDDGELPVYFSLQDSLQRYFETLTESDVLPDLILEGFSDQAAARREVQKAAQVLTAKRAKVDSQTSGATAGTKAAIQDTDDVTTLVGDLFIRERFVPSSAWTAPTAHHLPDFRQMAMSQSSAEDIAKRGSTLLSYSPSSPSFSRVSTASATDVFYYSDMSLFVSDDRVAAMAAYGRELTDMHREAMTAAIEAASGATDVRQVLAPWDLLHQVAASDGINLLAIPQSSIPWERYALAKKSGLYGLGLVVAQKRLPWNMAQSLAVCETIALFGAPSHDACGASARQVAKSLFQLLQRLEEENVPLVVYRETEDSTAAGGPTSAAPSTPKQRKLGVNAFRVIPTAAEVTLLFAQFEKAKQLVVDRAFVSMGTVRQSSGLVNSQRLHHANSAALLTNSLCSGHGTAQSLPIRRVKETATINRALWNEALHSSAADELAQIARTVTDHQTNFRGEELLLQKVKIWDPLMSSLYGQRLLATSVPEISQASADRQLRVIAEYRQARTQRDADATELLFRPTVLCVTIAKFGEEAQRALLQYATWGDQCDSFVIGVVFSPTDVQETAAAEKKNADDDAHEDPANPKKKRAHRPTVKHLSPGEVQSWLLEHTFPELRTTVNFPDANLIPIQVTSDQEKLQNAWNHLQVLLLRLEVDWANSQYGVDAIDDVFQYYMIVPTDVVAIPENLYSMLLEPEWMTLHGASAPLLIGNVLQLSSSEGLAERFSYPAMQGGVLLNDVSLRLFLAFVLNSEACLKDVATNAWDVMLTQCLRLRGGVVVRDAVDELGEERFHGMSLHWLLYRTVIPHLNKTAALLAQQRAHDANHQENTQFAQSAMEYFDDVTPRESRGLLEGNPFRTLSSSSVTFAHVRDTWRMLWTYMQLHHLIL